MYGEPRTIILAAVITLVIGYVLPSVLIRIDRWSRRG